MHTRDAFFIGGTWTAPAGDAWVDVVSPTTEQTIGRLPESTTADIDAAVVTARKAFDEGPWPHLSIKERGDYLLQIAAVLRRQLAEIVDLQIEEMGSPRSFIEPTTGGTIAGIAGSVAQASQIDTREIRTGSAGKVIVYRNPIGVVASILPWNAPVPVVLARMCSALLTGCTIIVKPPPESPLSPYCVADAVREVGLPEGVFSLVPGGREVGEYLVRHPGIDKVSFTGSSAAGIRVAQLCGESLKRATLELGGKSAAVVLDDADLERDVPALIRGSMPNTGQVCNATTRILAPRSRSKELVERLVGAVSELKVGDPHEADTVFGPLVAERQRVRVEGYIRSGREQGATVALGGGRPPALTRGWYVEPTIFTDVDNNMKIAQEEIFGPVVCVINYDTDEEAISIANDSDFGLGGAVFTTDIPRGLLVAERITTGSCRINDAPAGGPFGGVKRSGIGREYDREGFDGYFELKSIAVPAGYDPLPS